jgi:hypothetical protein
MLGSRYSAPAVVSYVSVVGADCEDCDEDEDDAVVELELEVVVNGGG